MRRGISVSKIVYSWWKI